ncbi:MAG: Rhomboid protease GluP [Lentisphaerae bacterium ADurb.BinA184]|nr:MAG: Rhomboid protease GluP [Lentisphaerae bacterium ADurb.BinA184]
MSAARIRHEIARHEGRWIIVVPARLTERALAELREYERVNRDWPPRRKRLGTFDLSPNASLFATAVVIAALTGWFVFAGPPGDEPSALDVAIADPARIQSGEWWRCVTALCLHGDIAHLLSNSLCLFFLGHAIGGMVGYGVGWLGILGSGFGGNALAAWLERDPVSAFGASTASFGALGLLAVLQVSRLYREHGGVRGIWNPVWIPMGAAVALLHFLGSAEGTHVAGHYYGFASGAGIGLVLLPLLDWRVPGWLQPPVFVGGATLVVWAWRLALAQLPVSP